MMTKENLTSYIIGIDGSLNYQSIYDLHTNVNQMYDEYLPYSFHLITARKTVINFMTKMFYEEWKSLSDTELKRTITSVLVAVTMHDVIEDCRMNYNDVYNFVCKTFMKVNKLDYIDCDASMIAGIVYALTDEKGRNREERHNETYWKVLRETEYAAFIKLCDRYTNMMYSKLTFSPKLDMYKKELKEIWENLIRFSRQELGWLFDEIKKI